MIQLSDHYRRPDWVRRLNAMGDSVGGAELSGPNRFVPPTEMKMKLASLVALALLALISPAASRAENPVTALPSLRVQIWPDYDRPAVLVMMTGTLGSQEPLPAFVNLPLLPGAQLNAVARADADGKLFDDIVYTTDAGKISLSTPNPTFRVEFYVPYRVEGGERRFTFDWLADVSVEALSMIVQQPASATSLVTLPAATTVGKGEDGMTYHVLPTRAVPAGEALAVQVSYAATTTALSAKPRPTSAPAAAPGPPPAQPPVVRSPATPAAAEDASLDWGLFVVILATAGMSIGITWQLARKRFVSGSGGESQNAEPPSERHCPGCGRPCATRDRFCNDCGRELPTDG